MKRPGRYIELLDGRKGMCYNDEPIPMGRVMIHLTDESFQPLRSEENGKKLVTVKLLNEIKVIGFFD